MDTHRRKEISDFGMALCLNESDITEAIKTVKALCAHTIREAEALYAHTIREAEACHTALVSKAKTHHVASVKEAEANHANTLAGAEEAHWIQQSHAKDMQCLEAKAINVERTDHLAFLTACGSALEASSPEAG